MLCSTVAWNAQMVLEMTNDMLAVISITEMATLIAKMVMRWCTTLLFQCRSTHGDVRDG